jgi:hypothetical protein
MSSLRGFEPWWEDITTPILPTNQAPIDLFYYFIETFIYISNHIYLGPLAFLFVP